MRISKIGFENFRCFSNEQIELSDYTALVGPNNCGKSTALRALNIFFGEGMKAGQISDADFAISGRDQELKLHFEFSDIDGDAAKDLSHYVRDGRLAFELVAQYNEGAITSKCRGIRYGLPHLSPFFAETKASGRKPLYEKLIADGAELPRWQNMEQAEHAVREYEARFSDTFVAIPSEESAYGATGPLPILKRHLDWIYVPAVKDASAEAQEQRNSAFSKLVLFAVRSKVDFAEQIDAIRREASDKLRDILERTKDVIGEVGGLIDREFKTLSTTPINVSLKWDQSESVNVREPGIVSIFGDGDFFERPENFGHGVQRAYIMALLNVAAKVQNQVESFGLILGIEEPELYQHPPQAKFLAHSLANLAGPKSQIIITTHSPFFVTGRNFESIRTLRKRANSTLVHQWTIEEQRAYCAKRKGLEAIGPEATLSGLDKTLLPTIAEMFFANKVILVEGMEDEAIISEYLQIKGIYNEFLVSGGHIVCVGGKQKMPVLLALARGMSIDTFCVFDFDMNQPAEKRKNEDISVYAQDNDINIPTEITENFVSSHFYASKDNIQRSIIQDYQNWQTILQEIATEWGWEFSRMDKDPMLLREGLRRTTEINVPLPNLDAMTECLREFWLR